MKATFNLSRLFVDGDLEQGRALILNPDQAHYLKNVMRLDVGAEVRLFNGGNGEWLGKINAATKRATEVMVQEQLRPQSKEPDIRLYCAPIKKAHFDYMIEKATELGVAAIQPLLTSRTQIREVNADRCRAIAIEAAEQSERLNVPEIKKPLTLTDAIKNWPQDRMPIICAETGEATPLHIAFTDPALRDVKKAAIITGPEGGFTAEEFEALRTLPHVFFIRLGPRILRADTAAIAALSCWQAICGDWKQA